MGTWGTGITSNDTAQDLNEEYKAAFYTYDPTTAVEIIDTYVRNQGIMEQDEEWSDYVYSLALFMWNHGLLTESVKNRALRLMKTGAGLQSWSNAIEKQKIKRKQAISDLESKILSPMPKKKKILLSLYLNPIFSTGDVIAFQAQTKEKRNFAERLVENNEFRSANEKYYVIRKVGDFISGQSRIVPSISDYWMVFQLYNQLFSSIPKIDDLNEDGWIKNGNTDVLFCCGSKISFFEKRKVSLLGNQSDRVVGVFTNESRITEHVFFDINNQNYNADSSMMYYIKSSLCSKNDQKNA